MFDNKKLIVDLDNPIWLSEPGFGGNSAYKPPYCAVGKAAECIDGFGEDKFDLIAEIKDALPSGVALSDIVLMNDEIPRTKENHYKAVRFLLESLKAGDKCEFVGTKASDANVLSRELVNA